MMGASSCNSANSHRSHHNDTPHTASRFKKHLPNPDRSTLSPKAHHAQPSAHRAPSAGHTVFCSRAPGRHPAGSTAGSGRRNRRIPGHGTQRAGMASRSPVRSALGGCGSVRFEGHRHVSGGVHELFGGQGVAGTGLGERDGLGRWVQGLETGGFSGTNLRENLFQVLGGGR